MFYPFCVAEEDELDGDIIHHAEHAGEVGGPSALAPVPLLRNADPSVLEALRDSYKLLVGRHLPTVLEWLKVAVKVITDTFTAIPCACTADYPLQFLQNCSTLRRSSMY